MDGATRAQHMNGRSTEAELEVASDAQLHSRGFGGDSAAAMLPG
jgi:hypothetical protein